VIEIRHGADHVHVMIAAAVAVRRFAVLVECIVELERVLGLSIDALRQVAELGGQPPRPDDDEGAPY
jgi:hypothetical protein